MVKVDIEYCGYCDFKSECQNLARALRSAVPAAEVRCRTGRKGAFEVKIEDKLVYSRLKTDDFPNPKEIIEKLRTEMRNEHIESELMKQSCILA